MRRSERPWSPVTPFLGAFQCLRRSVDPEAASSRKTPVDGVRTTTRSHSVTAVGIERASSLVSNVTEDELLDQSIRPELVRLLSKGEGALKSEKEPAAPVTVRLQLKRWRRREASSVEHWNPAVTCHVRQGPDWETAYGSCPASVYLDELDSLWSICQRSALDSSNTEQPQRVALADRLWSLSLQLQSIVHTGRINWAKLAGACESGCLNASGPRHDTVSDLGGSSTTRLMTDDGQNLLNHSSESPSCYQAPAQETHHDDSPSWVSSKTSQGSAELPSVPLSPQIRPKAAFVSADMELVAIADDQGRAASYADGEHATAVCAKLVSWPSDDDDDDDDDSQVWDASADETMRRSRRKHVLRIPKAKQEYLVSVPASCPHWGIWWLPGTAILEPLLEILESPTASIAVVTATLETLERLLRRGAARGLVLDEQRDVVVTVATSSVATDAGCTQGSATASIERFRVLGRRWLDLYARERVLARLVVVALTRWYQQQVRVAGAESALLCFLHLVQTIVDAGVPSLDGDAVASSTAPNRDTGAASSCGALPVSALESLCLMCLHCAAGRHRLRSPLLRRRGEEVLVKISELLFRRASGAAIRKWMLRLIAAMIDPTVADAALVICGEDAASITAESSSPGETVNDDHVANPVSELRRILWEDKSTGRAATEWLGLGLLNSSVDANRRRKETQLLGLRMLHPVLDALIQAQTPISEQVLGVDATLRALVLGPLSLALLRCLAQSDDALCAEVHALAFPLALKLVECLGPEALTFFHTLLTVILPSALEGVREAAMRSNGSVVQELCFPLLRQLLSRLDLLWSAYLAYDCSLQFADALGPLFQVIANASHPFAVPLMATLLESLQQRDWGPRPLRLKPCTAADWDTLYQQRAQKQRRQQVLDTLAGNGASQRDWNATDLWKSLQKSQLLGEGTPPEPAATPSAASLLAQFLRATPELDKVLIGQVIGSPDPFSQQVLAAYAQTFDLHQLPIDAALRLFLESFRLPGESQKIDRIMQAFATHYFNQNQGPSLPLASADAAHVLSFAMIMLNTDQHHGQVKQRMTLADFTHNNRGINDGDDLPAAYLQGIYERIRQQEIRLSDDHGVAALDRVHWEALLRNQQHALQVGSGHAEQLWTSPRRAAACLLGFIWPTLLEAFGSRLVLLLFPPGVASAEAGATTAHSSLTTTSTLSSALTERPQSTEHRSMRRAGRLLSQGTSSGSGSGSEHPAEPLLLPVLGAADPSWDQVEEDALPSGDESRVQLQERWLTRWDHWRRTIVEDQGPWLVRYRTRAALREAVLRLFCRLGWTAHLLAMPTILGQVLELLTLLTGLVDDRWPEPTPETASHRCSLPEAPYSCIQAPEQDEAVWVFLSHWKRSRRKTRSATWLGRHRPAQQVLVAVLGLAARCLPGLDAAAWCALTALQLRLVEMRLTSPLLIEPEFVNWLPALWAPDGTLLLPGRFAPPWASMLRDLALRECPELQLLRPSAADVASPQPEPTSLSGCVAAGTPQSPQQRHMRKTRSAEERLERRTKHTAADADTQSLIASRGIGGDDGDDDEDHATASAAQHTVDAPRLGDRMQVLPQELVDMADDSSEANSYGASGSGLLATLLSGIGFGFSGTETSTSTSADSAAAKGRPRHDKTQTGGDNDLERARSWRAVERLIADPEPDELSDLDAYRSPTECAPSTRNADASLSQPATTTTTTAADTGAGKTTAPETEPWRRLVVEDSWDLVRAVFPRYLRKPDMDAERRALTRRCLVYALQQANLFDPARWMTASAGLLEALGHAACWAYQLPMPAATRAVALETLHPDSGNQQHEQHQQHQQKQQQPESALTSTWTVSACRWFPRRALWRYAHLSAADTATWRKAWLLEHVSLVVLSDVGRMLAHWGVLQELVHMEMATAVDDPTLSLECAVFALVRLVLRVLAVAERSLSDRVCWTILAAVYKNLRLLMPLATSAFDALCLPVLVALGTILERYPRWIPPEDGWETLCLVLERALRQSESTVQVAWQVLMLLLARLDQQMEHGTLHETEEFPLQCLELLLTAIEQPYRPAATTAASTGTNAVSPYGCFQRLFAQRAALLTGAERCLPLLGRLARVVATHRSISVRYEALVTLERILMEPLWQNISESSRVELFTGVLLPLAEALQWEVLSNESTLHTDPVLRERLLIRLVMVLNRFWLLQHMLLQQVPETTINDWWMRLVRILGDLYAVAVRRSRAQRLAGVSDGRWASAPVPVAASETLAEHIHETLKNTLLVMVTGGFLDPTLELAGAETTAVAQNACSTAARRWSETFTLLAPLFPALEEDLLGLLAQAPMHRSRAVQRDTDAAHTLAEQKISPTPVDVPQRPDDATTHTLTETSAQTTDASTSTYESAAPSAVLCTDEHSCTELDK